MKKRLDLRIPMGERRYPTVARPIMVTVPSGFGQPPTAAPCRECPLARAALSGALGGYTVAQYLEVLHGPADIACHMSKGFPKDRATQRSCTGVAAYRANVGLLPAGYGARQAVLLVGADRAAVFASPAEFARHHRKDP
jgi:hypothetical protein